MDVTSIPTVADLTPAWFTELFRSTGDLGPSTGVAEVALEPFGNAESMMSALYRARLAYDGPTEAPSTVVVKLASASDRQRFIAGMFKFYEREIRFYRELQAGTAVRSPRCYLAHMHDSEPMFVLVLEEVRGLRQVDQVEGCGLDDAHTVVRALADLHAGFWGREFGGLADTFIPMNAPPMHAVIPAAFKGDWVTARGRVVDDLPAEIVALGDRHEAIASRLLDDMMGPDTLMHGDPRIDNLLFGDGAGDVLILDYQLAAIGNGLCDIAYFVSQSVHDDVAAEHADALVDAYLARLAEHGVIVDRAEAMRPYRAALVFFLSIPVSLLAGTDLPERSERLARTMLRRAAAEILRTGTHLVYA